MVMHFITHLGKYKAGELMVHDKQLVIVQTAFSTSERMISCKKIKSYTRI
jgi:hypothetical protein